MKSWKNIQPAVALAARNLDRAVPLRELAARAALSPSRAHRLLRAALGETPKQYTLRLRVDRAALALVRNDASVLDIALEHGFESHETFCRAFRRRFGMTPTAYRKRAMRGRVNFASEIGPCVGLYHIDSRTRNTAMEYAVTKKQLTAQPVLMVRRRVARADVAATIGAELPKVFLHAQKNGLAISGFPITRYPEISMGMVTLETGMRVSSQDGKWSAANGEGEVLAETLPAGPAAVTLHSGSYDQLPAAYAAIEQWIAAHGYKPGGAPWEAYLNDPSDHPDPKDWKTEVYWPLKS